MQVVEIQNPPPMEALVERFGRGRLPFVLDSAQSNDGLGEWSFFGADPSSLCLEISLRCEKLCRPTPRRRTRRFLSPAAQLVI